MKLISVQRVKSATRSRQSASQMSQLAHFPQAAPSALESQLNLLLLSGNLGHFYLVFVVKMRLPFLSPFQPCISKSQVSPCSPRSLHQSWHQLLTYRSIWPCKLRYPHSPEQFAHLSADRHEIEKLLAIYSKAHYAPSYLTDQHVIELLQYRDKSKLGCFRHFLMQELRSIRKKFKRNYHPTITSREFPKGMLFDSSTNVPLYGLCNINLVNNYKIPKLRNVYEAAVFGTKLAIDFSYDHMMRPVEFQSIVTQIESILYYNHSQNDPFDLVLTNFSGNPFFMERFLKSSALGPMEHFFSVYEKPVYEVFPKDQIIYLSPNAEDELKAIDHTKIYVIGALVDTFQTGNSASRDYCKENGLRMVKLPLDSLPVNVYSKRLTLTAVAGILSEINSGVDLIQAMMNHLPVRKTKDVKFREIRAEEAKKKLKALDPLYELFDKLPRRASASINDIIQCTAQKKQRTNLTHLQSG